MYIQHCKSILLPGVRTLELFNQYIVPAMHVHLTVSSEVPPWLFRKPEWHLDLTNENMLAVHSFVWELRLCLVIVGYKDHLMLYSDTLKTASRVESSFVVQGISYSWTLLGTVSVYTAELYSNSQVLWY